MTVNAPLTLDADILFRAVGDEGVVVDQRSSSVLVVNAVALRILELLREGLSAVAISARLADEFDAQPHSISTDVQTFLAELRRRRMIH